MAASANFSNFILGEFPFWEWVCDGSWALERRVPEDRIQDMMQEAQQLLKKALALPDKERADVAGSLIDSLDDTIDENAEAAWQDEVARRFQEVRAGNVKTTSWDDVRTKGRTPGRLTHARARTPAPPSIFCCPITLPRRSRLAFRRIFPATSFLRAL
jgi:putative addiction module component (TIGR02574 family)